MENILTKILLLLSAVIASFGALFSQISPETIKPLDPMPEVVIELPKENEPVSENKATLPKSGDNIGKAQPIPKPVTPDPIVVAYEIGKSAGYIQGVADTIKEELPIEEENDIPEKIIKEETPVVPIPEVSKADMQLKSLGKSNEIPNPVEIGAQVQIGVVLLNDAGEYDRTSGVTMTTPDEDQNTTKSYANTQKGHDGIWYYHFQYFPKTAGDHELTFTGAGLSKSVTIKAE